ncbi:MAG TPA: DNA methyltransferase [Bacteroidota bacterium]|nr:DNA methyltransferase [Bacteroidota bacterium]
MRQPSIAVLPPLHAAMKLHSLSSVRSVIVSLSQSLQQKRANAQGEIVLAVEKAPLHINKSYVLAELAQISESQTLPRAQYYIRRLIKALTETKTGKLNDLNLHRWKEYSDILTDSLWLVDKRDRSGEHTAGYWGNFIPQIPNQLLRRFTKKGEWVLDPFLGSGTSLIECKRLGRNGAGIELQQSVARAAQLRVEKEKNPFQVQTAIFTGNSSDINIKQCLKEKNISSVQFALLHPPYWDIIKFSHDAQDLSNAGSLKEFLQMFGKVVKNVHTVLDAERYMAIVISDKYCSGEWVPLGFLTMEKALQQGFKLKSIIVKNFETTKAKRSQEELWRYRALVGGLYVFKHEYIFLMQKTK